MAYSEERRRQAGPPSPSRSHREESDPSEREQTPIVDRPGPQPEVNRVAVPRVQRERPRIRRRVRIDPAVPVPEVPVRRAASSGASVMGPRRRDSPRPREEERVLRPRRVRRERRGDPAARIRSVAERIVANRARGVGAPPPPPHYPPPPPSYQPPLYYPPLYYPPPYPSPSVPYHDYAYMLGAGDFMRGQIFELRGFVDRLMVSTGRVQTSQGSEMTTRLRVLEEIALRQLDEIPSSSEGAMDGQRVARIVRWLVDEMRTARGGRD